MENSRHKQQVLEILDNQKFKSGNKMTCSSAECSFQKLKLPVGSFMEEIKPIKSDEKNLILATNHD